MTDFALALFSLHDLAEDSCTPWSERGGRGAARNASWRGGLCGMVDAPARPGPCAAADFELINAKTIARLT
ncbi:MAG: hypothetical protein ACREFP_18045 [Acetobacteraceae bacterium]